MSILEFRNASLLVGDEFKPSLKAHDFQIREILQFPVIVTLGIFAEAALRLTRSTYFPHHIDWDHFFLPHPSGLNRKLNDQSEHAKAVDQLKQAYRKFLTWKVYEGRV